MEMVKAIAAASAAANALGDVTADPDTKNPQQQYENLSDPEKKQRQEENSQLVASEDVNLPTVSMPLFLFIIIYLFIYFLPT